MGPDTASSAALVPFARKRPFSLTHHDARSPQKRMRESPSTVDWDKASVTLRIGAEQSVFRVDAGLLREKSMFFRNRLGHDWDGAVEIQLPVLEPHEFKIYKDWLLGRQPRWFEHYGDGWKKAAAEELDPEDQWPVEGVKLNAWMSNYCHHLCRLSANDKLTVDDQAGVKKPSSVNEPDWTTAFVLAPGTLRLIFREMDCDSPIRAWAADVVAPRLDIGQLDNFSRNDLPEGHMIEVYQAKFQVVDAAHCEELRRRNAVHEQMRKELNGQAEDRFQECWRAGCAPNKHRSCKLSQYRDLHSI